MSGSLKKNSQQDLKKALSLLESEALNFAARFMNDPRVRRQYLAGVRNLSEEYLRRVRIGSLSPKAAAEEVSLLRNSIMQASRLKLSDLGCAYSVNAKETGKTLMDLLEHYARKNFKMPFDQLNVSQQNAVYLDVIESAGRARPSANIMAKRLSRLGRGLLVVTVGIAVYNVATADNTLKATLAEGATLGGGILGGAAGGAVAGLACGPGAPVCVGLGIFIGGALGALGGGFAFDELY